MRVATVAVADTLTRTWSRPAGVIGWLSQVNHKAIGVRFIVTAWAFFILAGLGALLMRIQLAQPNLTILSDRATKWLTPLGRIGGRKSDLDIEAHLIENSSLPSPHVVPQPDAFVTGMADAPPTSSCADRRLAATASPRRLARAGNL